MRRILLATTAIAGLVFAPILWAQERGGGPAGGAPGAGAPGGSAEPGRQGAGGAKMTPNAESPSQKGEVRGGQEPGKARGEETGQNREQPGKARGEETTQNREQSGKAANQREERGERGQAATPSQMGPNEGQRQGAEQAPGGQQGGRAAATNLSSEQRTKVESNLRSVNVREATNINITNVRVGATVPHSVVEYWEPVPSEIVTIVPAWRSYRIVRIHGELVIIDPSTFDIVYVLA